LSEDTLNLLTIRSIYG